MTEKLKYTLLKLVDGWAVAMRANQYIVETFKEESDATNAMREFEGGTRFVPDKQEVWVVDGCFVTEPELGGMQIGEVDELDMNQFEVVGEPTQEEFDSWCEEYKQEHGHYPDT